MADDIKSKLDGLSKAQLLQIAKDLGVAATPKDTVGRIRDGIAGAPYRSARQGARMIQARDELYRPSDPKEVAASAEARRGQTMAKLDESIAKARSGAAPEVVAKASKGSQKRATRSQRAAAIDAFAKVHQGLPPKSYSTSKIEEMTKNPPPVRPRLGDREVKAMLKQGLVTREDVKGARTFAALNALADQRTAAREPLASSASTKAPTSRPPLLSEAHAKSIERMSAPMPPGSTWRDRAYGTTPAAPAVAPRMGLGQAYNTFNRVAAPVATAVTAAHVFRAAKAEGQSTGYAALNAGIAAAPGAALMAARPLGQALSNFGSGGMSLGKDLVRSGVGSVTDFALGFPLLKVGLASGAVGAVAKVTGEGLKIAGRVAAPLMAGYGAYQGAKVDGARGAVRGAIGALDPTAIVSNLGAAAGLMTDSRGLGERVFDAAFGKAGPTGQARAFEDANAKFKHADASGSSGAPRGWANPANQAAAQRARGVQNVTDWANGATPKGAR